MNVADDPERDIHADEDFVAGQIRAALDLVFGNVSLQGYDAEYEVTWHPKGPGITAVNMIASAGTELERVREALVIAIQQIDALL